MTLGSPGVTVVEEVLRDGCYVREFALTTAEVAEVVSRADGLSFVDLVDVGPGTGFGTTDPEPRPSAETYLGTASEAVSDTGLTTLLLPGVAGPAEVELLAAYEDAFELIRVGVDVTDPSAARSLLDSVADIDADVSLNLLKTYLAPPRAAARAATVGVERGADVVYVVDSAGRMTPSDVQAYVTDVATAADVEVGYHGHDNTGFGLVNTMAAIRAGASYVDTSLQGIGRSAGNVQTELLCARFLSEVPPADWRRLAAFEECLADVYPGEGGVGVADVLYGAAGLHSSVEGRLREFAAARGEAFTDLLVFAALRDLSTVPDVRAAYEACAARPRN